MLIAKYRIETTGESVRIHDLSSHRLWQKLRNQGPQLSTLPKSITQPLSKLQLCVFTRLYDDEEAIADGCDV